MGLLNLKEPSVVIQETAVNCVVYLKGEFALNNAKKITSAIEQLIEKNKLQIILDLVDCDYLDSCTIGAILSMQKKLKSFGGEIKLTKIPEKIQELLVISQIEKYFEVI